MEENKKISIIVPVYNAERTVERCIKSLINQTYKDLEILLIDDGSKDKSLEICNKYKEIDNRINVISKKNSGVSSTRNLGIKKSTGKYIQFVDSDDYIDNTMCERLISKIENSKCDFLICGYKNVDDMGNFNGDIYYDDRTFKTLKDMNGHFEKMYSKNLINTPWNKLYIKEFIIDGFDEDISLGEDLLFNLKYMSNIQNGISVINDCLYYYVDVNKGSLTSRFRNDRIEIGKILKKNTHDFCKCMFGENYNRESIDIPFAYLIQETINICIKDANISFRDKNKIINNIILDKDVQLACKNVKLYSLHSNISNFLIKNKLKLAVYSFHKLKMKLKK
ncbi:glycosyltransferase family 2 protein [Clostridium baratii]|uniref:Glycosyl transferase 2 family protein n=1 Tax=Clostridium baratii str. Sullivan TaxID=1415775 RepID=A0A0A7FXV2_9CLOT|nr:glycosyltransferase family 2 protein [Clostridium baratii]AIY84469.1 glycosyl transferase 2 family protein [Clostridium baratii str. Sullivan]MDU4912092.1 glycosyltransferase family 2 protein [Clostridium baratii]